MQNTTRIKKYDSDDDEKEHEIEVFVVLSKQAKCFMIGLCKSFEQLEMNREKCKII